MLAQLARLGVPADCHDGIVTSGDVTRTLIAEGVPEHLAILVRKVEPEPVAKPNPAKPRPSKLALVVEDDADVRNLATAVLEESDLDVIACDTAEAAISVLERAGGNVALLFADVRLGAGMDVQPPSRSAVTQA